MILWIKVGIKDKVVKLVFPVKITVTKDEPVATLEGHFNFDKSRFTFITYKYVSDGGWEQIVWTNDLEYVDDPRFTIMSNARKLADIKKERIYECREAGKTF